MSDRIRGSYDDAPYKSTYTLLYCTYFTVDILILTHLLELSTIEFLQY